MSKDDVDWLAEMERRRDALRKYLEGFGEGYTVFLNPLLEAEVNEAINRTFIPPPVKSVVAEGRVPNTLREMVEGS